MTNHVEISIWGGGVGESILIKSLEGKWIIIDSCCNPKTKKPVALEYLIQRGIDVVNDVVCIIATHWHDDHIKGLSELVEACTNAKIIISAALNRDEFYSLVSTNENHERVLQEKSSGIKEFSKIYNFLIENNQPRLSWASKDKVFINESNLKVITLSPSDTEVSMSLERLTEYLPDVSKPLRVIPSRGPNHTAVVTFIKIGEMRFIFGADLEESSDQSSGWHSIVNTSVLIEKGIDIIKIPHHGSENGHNEKLWTDYLIASPYALLTPYTRSKLPRNEDIDRILNKSEKSFCTSHPEAKFKHAQDNAIEKTIKEVTKSYKAFKQNIGQIKVTKTVDQTEFEVELIDSAKHLKEFKR